MPAETWLLLIYSVSTLSLAVNQDGISRKLVGLLRAPYSEQKANMLRSCMWLCELAQLRSRIFETLSTL